MYSYEKGLLNANIYLAKPYLKLDDSVLVDINISCGDRVFTQFTGHEHHG